ncbi:HAD family hydrolase [Pseudomonas sp. XK-1]|uniref:HAD family hydrolase n=1 Tax=Pseudomonas sp. XK-1 TaxID=3136019 RepID=UPI003119394D
MGCLSIYDVIIFDCDGVVLNSNKVKTDAFYESARSYGESYARALVEYHVRNGGVSRYKKYEYFFTDILKVDIVQEELDFLLSDFAIKVRQGLLSCNIADGLEELRSQSQHAKWFIVSGGDQAELREIFSLRGLERFFDGGIFGSPDSKDLILHREVAGKLTTGVGLFIGDSQYDYEAATRAGLDFIFVKEWSEFSGAESYFEGKKLKFVNSISELCL